MFKSSVLLIFFLLSVANCQFFYNYEEERLDEPPTGTQNYNPSAYQYNSPSAVNQQFAQPRGTDFESSSEGGQRRTRIRVRSRNYQSDPDYNDPQQQTDSVPTAGPEYDQRAVRQERRQTRRRQTQRYHVEPPTQPPRVYSPSIFENVGLGEAPSGVYIPNDSFLNVLRRAPASRAISQPASPQVTNYVQPSVNYVNNEPQPRFFVQPPSNEEPRQTNLILPVTRPQTEYVAPIPFHQARGNRNSIPQTVPVATERTNRRSHQRVQSYAPPQPTVDIDSFREFTDDVTRESLQVMPKVEYAPVTVRQETRSQNRRRKVTRYQVTSAPRVYSPSVFENVGLGEAPSGIYVPDDSLLNVLRNPSSGHHASSRVSRRETQHLQAQPTYNTQNDHVPDVIEEEQYQPPLPPPPPTKRRASQRSRQPQPLKRAESTDYQNNYDDQTAVQPVQHSSQRRSQRRNDNEDFSRQRPPVQQQTQSRRKPAPAPAPRQQPKPSTSEREQSSFRKAKLAIAALPLDTDDDGIPGEAGVNYPTLHKIPRTTFSCSQQSHNGYYADLETSCQVVHLCQSGGVQNSFLCPNGTIFSQEKFSCQWWYKVNCSEAPKFYIKNDELYKVPEKKERKRN